MAAEVEFENFQGIQHALYEDFPLGGGDVNVKCLVIQNEDGRPPVRVKADSPEADRYRQRYPALKDLDSNAGSDQPAATPAAVAHAEELGVDISTVKGTGAGGQITKTDVAAAAGSA